MRHLVVMLKEPKAGRVKTRLGKDIGMVNAAWWYRHQTSALLRRLQDPRWQLWLSVSPDRAAWESRTWPRHLPKRPQGSGDIGERMLGALNGPMHGPVCVIGSDIPEISAPAINRAFQALGNHDAVFGPATDGGFWLVGLKRTTAIPAGMFKGVRWSSDHALADSIATLSGSRVALVDELDDVDTAADLARISK